MRSDLGIWWFKHKWKFSWFFHLKCSLIKQFDFNRTGFLDFITSWVFRNVLFSKKYFRISWWLFSWRLFGWDNAASYSVIEAETGLKNFSLKLIEILRKAGVRHFHCLTKFVIHDIRDFRRTAYHIQPLNQFRKLIAKMLYQHGKTNKKNYDRCSDLRSDFA